jgi:hypothetical protein
MSQSLSSLWVRYGACPRLMCLKGTSLRQATALLTNIRLGWKCFPVMSNFLIVFLSLIFEFKKLAGVFPVKFFNASIILTRKTKANRRAPYGVPVALLANIKLSFKTWPELKLSLFCLSCQLKRNV